MEAKPHLQEESSSRVKTSSQGQQNMEEGQQYHQLKRGLPNEAINHQKVEGQVDLPSRGPSTLKGPSNGLTRSSTLSYLSRVVENMKSKNNPNEVHFREMEEIKIKNFLGNYLVGPAKGNSTLVVTGKPGAGKTLLINNILQRLKKQQYEFFDFMKDGIVQNDQDKKIEILELNAMKFSNCFPFLLETMSYISKKANIEFNKNNYKNSVYLLESFKLKLVKILKEFKFVILIDELDTLATHDRKDFDMIFEFLNICDKGFIKIGISNTLDLFATYKGTKNYLRSKQLTFKPYKVDDLFGILKERIQEVIESAGENQVLIVDDKVLKVICQKIYKNASGDIRAMLSVAKEIFEMKLKELQVKYEQEKLGGVIGASGSLKITLQDAMKILNSKYEDRTIDVIKSFSWGIQVALFALFYCITSKIEICSLSKFRQKLEEAKLKLSIDVKTNLDEILSTLEIYNFLKIEKNPVKGKKFQGDHIRSIYKKNELQEYLMNIPTFEKFINQEKLKILKSGREP